MQHIKLKGQRGVLRGKLCVPGDKSISHRSVILGSLAKGTTIITNFLNGEDCLATIAAFRAMGIEIEQDNQVVTITGKGIEELKEPLEPINLGNSGTTARLLLGVLAGLPFHSTLYGDDSLTKRPMDRITDPLRTMGAKIDGRAKGKYLPLAVRGQQLTGITYHPPVKSAQVKSGVLLAGLLAEGTTTVVEKTKTRDHTENMLQAFGAKVDVQGLTVKIKGKQSLKGTSIQVPGDISSAAFFIGAAAMVPGSKITIEHVGLNPTRTGILDVVKAMGAKLSIVETSTIGGEKVGTITVEYSELKGITIAGDVIPRMIDELPIAALLATQAKGETVIKDAEELRFKETDRIATVANVLTKLGAHINPTEDGMVIKGVTPLTGTNVESYGDHRIGMMIAIASLVCQQEVILENPDAINVSYPGFFEDLNKLV